MNFNTSRLESLPWGCWGLQAPTWRLRPRSKCTFERFASWFWWRWRKWVWKTSLAERGSCCGQASSNTPANKGEGRANANGTPPYGSLEAPDGELLRQQLRYPSAAARRRQAYPSKDILTREAVRQRYYRFTLFCESRGTSICICLAKNIVSLCVQTILTHNA